MEPFIHQLPLETIHHIIVLLDPPDVASLALTGKYLCSALYSPSDSTYQYVWRELFLRIFDDPRIRRLARQDPGAVLSTQAVNDLHFDFKAEYQSRIRASNALRSRFKADTMTSGERKAVLRAVLGVVHTAAPFPHKTKNGTWLAKVFESLGLWCPWTPTITTLLNPTSDEGDVEEQALRAELHLYIGLKSGDTDPRLVREYSGGEGESAEAWSEERPHLHRILARSYVYDLDNYTSANHYAPLCPPESPGDGFTINFRHMEHVMTDLFWNLQERLPYVRRDALETEEDYRRRITPPMDLDGLRPYSAPGWEEQFALKRAGEGEDTEDRTPIDGRPDTEWEPWEDWAGVEGVWHRIFSFMNYPDLVTYNVARLSADPSITESRTNISVFDQPGFHESTKFVTIALRITSIERSSPNSNPNRPRINYKGLGHYAATRREPAQTNPVIGYVEELPSSPGVIRWHTETVMANGAEWCTDQIQVGGVGSARGIIGSWSATARRRRDPAGPSWSWKVLGREALDTLDQ